MDKGTVKQIVTQNPDRPKNVNTKPLGISGLSRQGGYVYEEFLPNLRWPRAGKVYKEMSSNDPTIGSILYLAEMLIRGTKWTVKPASNSKADIEAAEFLTTCMDDMENTWASTICDIISMMVYGFSFHEIVYKVRRGPFEKDPRYKSKYSDARIGWRKIPIRSQDSLLEWEFDDEGNTVAFVQQAEPNYNIVRIPISKGILFRTTTTRENPEGKSLLRNAYRPWYFKKHFEEIEGIGIERDLAGFPVLTAPEGVDIWSNDDPAMMAIRNSAESVVKNVRRDSEEGLILPFGWDLKLLASSSSRQIDVGATIDRYDKRIAMTLLSDIVLMGDKSGSFALADTKESMLAAALQSHLENIADTFNGKAIPDLFYLNNFDGLTDFPKLVPGQIQTPSLKEVALIMRAVGFDVTKDLEVNNCIRRMLSFPEITEEKFKELYPVSAKVPNNAGDITEATPGQNPNKRVRNDTAERDLEQNDLAYVGGEGE